MQISTLYFSVSLSACFQNYSHQWEFQPSWDIPLAPRPGLFKATDLVCANGNCCTILVSTHTTPRIVPPDRIHPVVCQPHGQASQYPFPVLTLAGGFHVLAHWVAVSMEVTQKSFHTWTWTLMSLLAPICDIIQIPTAFHQVAWGLCPAPSAPRPAGLSIPVAATQSGKQRTYASSPIDTLIICSTPQTLASFCTCVFRNFQAKVETENP